MTTSIQIGAVKEPWSVTKDKVHQEDGPLFCMPSFGSEYRAYHLLDDSGFLVVEISYGAMPKSEPWRTVLTYQAPTLPEAWRLMMEAVTNLTTKSWEENL